MRERALVEATRPCNVVRHARRRLAALVTHSTVRGDTPSRAVVEEGVLRASGIGGGGASRRSRLPSRRTARTASQALCSARLGTKNRTLGEITHADTGHAAGPLRRVAMPGVLPVRARGSDQSRRRASAPPANRSQTRGDIDQALGAIEIEHVAVRGDRDLAQELLGVSDLLEHTWLEHTRRHRTPPRLSDSTQTSGEVGKCCPPRYTNLTFPCKRIHGFLRNVWYHREAMVHDVGRAAPPAPSVAAILPNDGGAPARRNHRVARRDHGAGSHRRGRRPRPRRRGETRRQQQLAIQSDGAGSHRGHRDPPPERRDAPRSHRARPRDVRRRSTVATSTSWCSLAT